MTELNDHGYELIDFAPRPPLDPDPLHVEAYEDGFVAGVAHGMERERRRDRLAGAFVLAATIALLIVAFVAGRASAAPRPAQTTERLDLSALSSAGPTVAPLAAPSPRDPAGPVAATRASGAPTPSPAAVYQQPTGPRPASKPAFIRGTASWYDDGPGLYAAVHSWRWGDRPYRLRVRAADRSVLVTVRDFCGCPGGRVVDLSPAAFGRLAPLSRGLVIVNVERVR